MRRALRAQKAKTPTCPRCSFSFRSSDVMRYELRTKKRSTPHDPARTVSAAAPPPAGPRSLAHVAPWTGATWLQKTARNAKNRSPSSSGR